jgi:chromate transporter
LRHKFAFHSIQRMKLMDRADYSLWQLVSYFLNLGATGFGGPVALVGYMHSDLVEKRRWLSDEEYKQGLTLAQLAPGPLAAQVAIYLGHVHYRLLGATLVGLAFVLPSFVMVVLLGIGYKVFGEQGWIQSAFYGIAPAVVGIILISSIKLTIKSIGKLNIQSLKAHWFLWAVFAVSAIITYVTEREEILFFIGAGFIYMLIKTPPKRLRKKIASGIFLWQIGFWTYETTALEKIAIYFAKAGTFVFGSGLAIVPFLHSGVVTENHWLTEKQFLDAVAIAMITPGPVVITVGFIGYLIAGFPGAVVAALATFLPCYLFTIILAPYFNKISKNASVKAFVDGITSAVVGALFGAVIVIGAKSLADFFTVIIAAFTIVALLYFKQIKEPFIIFACAIAGITIKSIL